MKQNRREFLRKSYKASIAVTLAPLLMPQTAAAVEPEVKTFPDGDYKALVYIMFEGGNDAFNMVLPVERDDPLKTPEENCRSYDTYYAGRGSALGVKDGDFSDALATKITAEGKLDFSSGNPYPAEQPYQSGFYRTNKGIGVNAVMPELAHMMNEGKVATVAAVGTLFEPLLDENNNRIGTQKPGFLGSHSTQRRMTYIGQSNQMNNFGWVGRLYDTWGKVNGDSVVASNISYNGHTHALLGRSTAPLVLRAGSPRYPSAMQVGEKDARESIAALPTDKPFSNVYNRMTGRSFKLGRKLVEVNRTPMTALDGLTNVYGDALFSQPTKTVLGIGDHIKARFFDQMQMALKMIKYGKDNGFKRQVFFVKFEGFDTHWSGGSNSQSMREFSMGMYDFQNALEALGVADNVTTFTTSEFGRSLRSNGNGTDHAWAGHNLIIGGAVKGGLYGEFPDWRLGKRGDEGGKQDSRRNGTIIPKIAMEQQHATIAKWFGADDATLHGIFGNLHKFGTTGLADGTYDLGFMQAPVTV